MVDRKRAIDDDLVDSRVSGIDGEDETSGTVFPGKGFGPRR